MTAEEQNALCERVQYLIAVGDPLIAEDKAHLDACCECKAFECDMASLDKALPTLAAGELTNKKGQTVAAAVQKELALQQRFASSKSLPKAFRHIGFAAAAVVVLVGGLVVVKFRQAMKPAGSAYVADKPMMLADTAFEAADDTAESVREEEQCEYEYEFEESAELPVEEEAANDGDMTQPDGKEAENKETAVNGTARAAEKPQPDTNTASVKDKAASDLTAHEDPATVTEEAAEEATPDLFMLVGNAPSLPTEAETVDEAVAEEEMAAEKPVSNGAGGGAARQSAVNSAGGILMKAALQDTKDEAVEETDDEAAILTAPAAEAADTEALPQLTMQTLEELAKKGDALTWDDFAPFDGYDVGSGLYIMRYDIDERYYVLVGGGSMQEKPMYIKLCDAQNADRSIDVRTDDIKSFIQAK